MASIRFSIVANGHYNFVHDGIGIWTEARVDQYSGSPRNYVTDDEGEAIKATDGEISPNWYDYQHGLGVAGGDMPADPNYGLLLAASEQSDSS